MYGLVRWPGFSDVELAEELGLSRTTVTVVRRRLEKKGLVSTHYVPDFRRAGCELLAALYGEFGGDVKSKADVLREALLDGVSSVFYMVKAGGRHLSLGAAENLTKVMENITAHHRIHHESGYLTDKRHNYIFFPLDYTRIHRYFDYAPLLAEEFGIKHEDKHEETIRNGEWNPTRRERKVFKALVEHPKATDAAVAKHAGVSRQTVNTLRNKFLQQGLLHPIRIPDAGKLGYGLLAFTHLHMSPHRTAKEREQHAEKILEDASHILKVAGDLETVMLSIHRDYGGFKKSHEKVLTHYKDMLSDDPVVHLYPLDEAEHILHHSYGNVV